MDAVGDGRAEAPRREGRAPAARFRGQFDLGEDFVYGVFSRDESEVVGGSGLHTRLGEGALEIGYWIRASRVGQGFARETAAALTNLAFAVCGVDRVEIHVDPANEASLRVPQALGFHEEATLRRRLPAGQGEPRRDVVVFSMFGEEHQNTAIARVAVAAFDALGRRVAV